MSQFSYFKRTYINLNDVFFSRRTDLREFLVKREKEILKQLKNIFMAIFILNRYGIFHYNVKAENIFLDLEDLSLGKISLRCLN